MSNTMNRFIGMSNQAWDRMQEEHRIQVKIEKNGWEDLLPKCKNVADLSNDEYRKLKSKMLVRGMEDSGVLGKDGKCTKEIKKLATKIKNQKQKEKVGICGAGFVGSAQKLILEKSGYDVKVFDKYDNSKTDVSNWQELLRHSTHCFVCVPTPMKKSGECDTSIVESVLEDIVSALEDAGNILMAPKICIKSTVPPGTTKKFQEKYNKHMWISFSPEFLTEANWQNDIVNATRCIVAGRPMGRKPFVDMYKKTNPEADHVEMDDPTVAEMSKYMINTFLAMKVNYCGEMALACDALGIDYGDVRDLWLMDGRIGKSHHLVPGPCPMDVGPEGPQDMTNVKEIDGKFYAYSIAGHCLPKDLNALISKMNELGVDSTMLSATWEKTLKLRPQRDWETLEGRAISKD